MNTIFHHKLFWVIPIAAMAVLVGLYIFQVNTLVALAWHISEQEQEVETLKQETAALEMQARQSLSLEDLEQLASSMNFEKITTISYLTMQPAGVATNQP